MEKKDAGLEQTLLLFGLCGAEESLLQMEHMGIRYC